MSYHPSFLVPIAADDKEAIKLIKRSENPQSLYAALSRGQQNADRPTTVLMLGILYLMFAGTLGPLAAFKPLAILVITGILLGWFSRKFDTWVSERRSRRIYELIAEERIIMVHESLLDDWHKCFEHIGHSPDRDEAKAQFIEMCQDRHDHLDVVRQLTLDGGVDAVQRLSAVLRERIEFGLYRPGWVRE